MNTYTALFGFCGIGGGALGFLGARAKLAGVEGRIVSVGGIDNDAAACRDFEWLTGSPALCCDVWRLTPAVLRAFAGPVAPDVVFASPPCKGFSALLGAKRAAEPTYQRLNRLVAQWVQLMLATWATPPKLVLIENVPRIQSRGRELLAEVRQLLDAAGYAIHEGAHDCGELGGLAQHRRRYLLVARHRDRVPTLLHRPPLRRVRGVGEVLETLPMPEDPAGGPMHRMPKISWLNWVRLALIPAGGDWRDLPGVLEDDQPRREVHRRHHVQRWDAPASTVAGSGSNGPNAVADPRPRAWFNHVYKVMRWEEPSGTVTGAGAPRSGAYGVLRWQEAASTIASSAAIGNGRFAVSDPRTGEIVSRVDDPRRPPRPGPPIIIAADGTWHRPLTTLELSALQGFPTVIDGAPLVLDGTSSSAWRERIGNAVPPSAAEAIAEQMLLTLLAADGPGFRLSSTASWVAPTSRQEQTREHVQEL